MEVENKGRNPVADGGGEWGERGEAGRDRQGHPGVRGETSTSLVKILIIPCFIALFYLQDLGMSPRNNITTIYDFGHR